MRLLHRHDEQSERHDRQAGARDREAAAPGVADRRIADEPATAKPLVDDRAADNRGADKRAADERAADERAASFDQEETIDIRTTRWDFGSVLTVAVGSVLAVIGAVALVRTGVNSTWYEPVEQVMGMDHTPLLGAVEVSVGVLLVLVGLAGARMLAALIAVVGAAAATVIAIEPDIVNPELAIEQGWAIALAIVGFALAAVLVVSRERRHDRRTERRSLRPA